VVINVAGMAMSGYIKEHLGYMGNFSLGIGSALLAMFYAAIFLKVSNVNATYSTELSSSRLVTYLQLVLRSIFLKVSSIIATSTQLSSSRLVADLQLVLCSNLAQG
jgi:hypothetical protein